MRRGIAGRMLGVARNAKLITLPLRIATTSPVRRNRMAKAASTEKRPRTACVRSDRSRSAGDTTWTPACRANSGMPDTAGCAATSNLISCARADAGADATSGAMIAARSRARNKRFLPMETATRTDPPFRCASTPSSGYADEIFFAEIRIDWRSLVTTTPKLSATAIANPCGSSALNRPVILCLPSSGSTTTIRTDP